MTGGKETGQDGRRKARKEWQAGMQGRKKAGQRDVKREGDRTGGKETGQEGRRQDRKEAGQEGRNGRQE